MRKSLILLFVLLLVVSFLNAKAYDIDFNQTNNSTYRLQFNLEDYNIKTVTKNNKQFTNVNFDSAVKTKKKGFAELPYANTSVQLTDNQNVDVRIISIDYQEIALDNPMLPSRGILYRNQDIEQIPYTISEAANTNSLYPESLVKSSDPYILRNVRGTNIYFYPFRYNQAQQTLRIYRNIEVELVKNNSNPINPLRDIGTVPPEMNEMYKTAFINYETERFEHELADFGSILVIRTSRDETAIQPYIEWKTQKGHTVYEEEVSPGTNVESLIQDMYDDHNDILYVQLVGDWADIQGPTNGYAPVDPNMGCVVGTDIYPDLIIGRFSGNSADDITVMVDKTITYERDATSETWYSKGLGIGSEQGSGQGDDGEADYTHIDIIKENKLLPFTYSEVSEAYQYPSVADVSDPVNEGLTVINYCGHGSHSSWVTSGFSNNDVFNLTNGEKLPFIWSVACVNGEFHTGGDCFAEAWTKKENGGAIAMYAATINQSWDPPMKGQDYMNDLLTGGYNYDDNPGNGTNTDVQKMSYGSISFNGSILMALEDPAGGPEMLETWHIFGDAALGVRTDSPTEMDVTHSPLYIGFDSMEVETDTENALVSLTSDGEILSSGITDESGNVTLNFDTIDDAITVNLTVTGFNQETYTEEFEALPATGAFITVSLDDIIDDNNSQADYTETVELEMSFTNVGVDACSDLTATITSSDEYVTIDENTINFDGLDPDESTTPTDMFEITLAEDIPDLYSIPFDITIEDQDDNLWESTFTVTGHAPVLDFGQMVINDQSGNNNGRLDPGETADLNIDIINLGSATAYNAIGEIITTDQYLAVNTADYTYGDVEADQTLTGVFNVTVSTNAPTGHNAVIGFTAEAEHNIITTHEITVNIGQIPVLILDFDETPISGPALATILDEENITYETAASIPDTLELYSSVFLFLGVYSNNYEITEDEGQALADYLNNGGNLYMEGGDTWYFDDQTAVHDMFGLSATDDGSSDLSEINGVEDTFTEGMSFGYSGENSWIDHLEASDADAEVIFQNSSPTYGCAVAFESGDYNTIGASFEFGGLNDGESTKAELAMEYLEFFGVGGGGAMLAIEPMQINFGEITIGESSTEEFTLTSLVDEEITGEITTPEGFEVASGRNMQLVRNSSQRNSIVFTLSSGESSTFELTFTPTAETTYNGFVTVDCVNPNEASYSLSVIGNGVLDLEPPQNLNIFVVNYNELEIQFDEPANRNINTTRSITKNQPQNRDLLGYNVYLDNELVAEEINESPYYYTEGLDEGTYEVGISAVYDNGESAALTETVTIEFPLPELEAELVDSDVNLSWTLPYPERERGLTGFVIYRDDLDNPLAETSADITEYTDNLEDSGTYEYWVKAKFTGGYMSEESNHETIEYVSTGENNIEYATELRGNYPNPFNPTTDIRFSLQEESHVSVVIYNLIGQKVKVLSDKVYKKGTYEVKWNGKDDYQKDVPSGYYFYRMKTDRYTSTKKMLLLK